MAMVVVCWCWPKIFAAAREESKQRILIIIIFSFQRRRRRIDDRPNCDIYEKKEIFKF